MGCGCGKGGGNSFRQQQQRARANLQSPRRQFSPPAGQIDPNNPVPTEPLSPNLQLPPPGTPETSAERRRIMRLQRDAINKRFNR